MLPSLPFESSRSKSLTELKSVKKDTRGPNATENTFGSSGNNSINELKRSIPYGNNSLTKIKYSYVSILLRLCINFHLNLSVTECRDVEGHLGLP